jgi:hypothetical protein
MKKFVPQKKLGGILSSLKKRFQEYQSFIIKLTALVILFVSIFISLSVYLHPEGTRYSFHFYLDTGAITILSSSFLTIASFLSFFSFLLSSSENKRLRLFFLIMSITLIYLVLDELFLFHETIGDNLDKTGFLKIIFQKTAIRRWNDLIIILYGVLALPVMLFFTPIVIKIPYILEFFILAFLCYAAHTTIDSVVEPATTPSYIIEESAKLFSSAFLVLGLYAGYQHVTKRR